MNAAKILLALEPCIAILVTLTIGNNIDVEAFPCKLETKNAQQVSSGRMVRIEISISKKRAAAALVARCHLDSQFDCKDVRSRRIVKPTTGALATTMILAGTVAASPKARPASN